MAQPPDISLTAEQRKTFNQQGFLLLPGFYDLESEIRPIQQALYQIIALVVLVISFLPDIAYAGSSMPGAMHSTSSAQGWPVAIVLMLMHVAAWAICVSILIKLSVTENK